MTKKEALDLLYEMRENCLKPESEDPKRFLKAEALTAAINTILKEELESKLP